MQPLRRRILTALALAPWAAANAAQKKQADVLVIGAGMAGLTCARELRQVGYSVIVLEARPRIGGRTWTDHSLGVPLDLGGAWIHGTKGNPLTSQVREAGIETHATDWEAMRLYAGKRVLSDSELSDVESETERLMSLLERKKARAKLGDDLGAALAAVSDEQLDDDVVGTAVRWQMWSDISTEYGEDAERLSLSGWNEDEEFPGKHVLLRTGYGALIEKLAAPLDIRLNTPVQSLEHDEEGVRVQTSQGLFTAEAAVCSVPLGVLQAGSLRFSPALPAGHRAAIKRLGMGALDKVALRFPKVFWPKDAHRFARVDAPPERRCEFYNLHLLHGVPILVALSAGARSRALEAMPESAVVAQMMDELRAIFGNGIPAPERTLRTRWASDPYARGSYSVIAPGGSLEDFATLAEAAGARLFMAGEATASDYPGTVHGALLSGVRAAGEVAEALG